MKIINAIHAQSIGGVDRVFRDYSEILLKQGHEVSLLISDNTCKDYNFLGLKKIFKLKNHAQIFDFLHLLGIIIFYCPDLIICHSARLMSWAKILRKIPFVKTKFLAINHGISFKKSLFCDYIVSINDDITKMTVDSGFDPQKTFTLNNAIKIDQKYQQKTLKNPPVIGIYGRIEARKGFDILIAACGILKQQGQNFILKVGGFEVPNTSWNWNKISELLLKHNVEQNCKKVGVVKDKKEFFSDVDIFCVPSIEEPFGIVILESFLHSTLVISSNTIGGKLLIKDGENGALFDNGNSVELAKKISEVLQKPEAYNAKTTNAFLQLEKQFSLDSLSRNMSKILSQICPNA